MRYVVSPDGGATFAREGGLGHGGNLDFAATANGVRFLGDYLGVTVSPTAAHAVWCLPSHPRGGSADPMHQVTFAATLQR
jgi:hypothetical protein